MVRVFPRSTPRLAYVEHAVSESRNCLMIAAQAEQASGTGERSTAIDMLCELSGFGTCQ